MSDLIQRQDAIDTALEFFVEFLGGAFHEDDQKILMKRMNELPSAEPKRKKETWKPFDLTWGRSVYSCTACGKAMDIPTEMSKPIYSFCPNCGARMEIRNNE